MIPEFGHLALILALGLALVQASLPLLGAWRGERLWMALARPAAWGQAAFLLFALACLGWAFLENDFSVAYVASNSNSALPWYYRLSALWGAHEGSLLLWAVLLAGWTLAVSLASRPLPEQVLARVLGVLGLLSSGFLLFLLLTSNPFVRLLPQFPADGRDLNPLLQDIGLVLHPPMLYMGYVGFAVPFAFAIAALLGGQLDAAWARWSRPWTLVAWAFLGLGIVLGSWWAYYELGWGGWWFWDPVENASLMPWLAGTALLHAQRATEKRGLFRGWTVLLAIVAFSLSLLGTFLVRSGVLTSVHAFATDPERGLFVLGFLLLVAGGSLVLFALRVPLVSSPGRFGFWSRETGLLVNNLLLLVATATVLLGTLYPLLLDALAGRKLSVGPPYFNRMFLPLMAVLLLVLGIGILLRWQDTPRRWLWQQLWPVVAGSLLCAGLVALFGDEADWPVWLVCGLAAWVILASLRALWQTGLRQLSRSGWGMHLAHMGLAVCALGVVLSTQFGLERDLRLAPGDTVALGGYTFEFEGSQAYAGPNFRAERGRILVLDRQQKLVALLHPEKRLYQVQQMPMTEAGIDAGLFRDLYVALGEPLEQGAWAVRVQVKPFVRWIWLGGLLMAAGGLLAATRQRRMKPDGPERAREVWP